MSERSATSRFSLVFSSRSCRSSRSSLSPRPAYFRFHVSNVFRQYRPVDRFRLRSCRFQPVAMWSGSVPPYAHVVVPSSVLLVNPEDHAARHVLKLLEAYFSGFGSGIQPGHETGEPHQLKVSPARRRKVHAGSSLSRPLLSPIRPCIFGSPCPIPSVVLPWHFSLCESTSSFNMQEVWVTTLPAGHLRDSVAEARHCEGKTDRCRVFRTATKIDRTRMVRGRI